VWALALLLGAAQPRLQGCAASSHLALAEAALDAGDELAAEQHLRAALKDPEQRDTALERLDGLLSVRAADLATRDPAAAEALYRELLGRHPDDDLARTGLARALLRQGQHDVALDVLDTQARCPGCAVLRAAVHLERGKDRIKAGDLAGAEEDLEVSMKLFKSPFVALARVGFYVHGEHGTADDALAQLRAAQLAMTPGAAAQQQAWAEARRGVVLAAASRDDVVAMEKALALPDPGRDGDPRGSLADQARLRSAAGRARLDAGALDEGVALAQQALAEGAELGGEALLAELRATAVDLLARRAAAHLAAGDVELALAGLPDRVPADDEGLRVLAYLQVIAAATRDHRSALDLLAALPPSDPRHARVEALVWATRAQEQFDRGQFIAARVALDRAAQLAPMLPDVHLVEARMRARARMPDLTKTDIERFRELATVSYPGNKITQAARALAHLDFLRRELGPKETRDVLHLPRFLASLTELEQEIRAYYPFEVKFTREAAPAVELRRGRPAAAKVTVRDLRRPPRSLELQPEATAAVTFAQPGLVVIEAPEARLGLFVEAYATIAVTL